jgi:hypothetical protein
MVAVGDMGPRYDSSNLEVNTRACLRASLSREMGFSETVNQRESPSFSKVDLSRVEKADERNLR